MNPSDLPLHFLIYSSSRSLSSALSEWIWSSRALFTSCQCSSRRSKSDSCKRKNPIKLVQFPINKSWNVDNIIRKLNRKFHSENLLQKYSLLIPENIADFKSNFIAKMIHIVYISAPKHSLSGNLTSTCFVNSSDLYSHFCANFDRQRLSFSS